MELLTGFPSKVTLSSPSGSMFLPSILKQDKVTRDDDHEENDDHNLVHDDNDDNDDDDDDLRKTMVDIAGTCISLAKPAFPMNSVFFFILVK